MPRESREAQDHVGQVGSLADEWAKVPDPVPGREGALVADAGRAARSVPSAPRHARRSRTRGALPAIYRAEPLLRALRDLVIPWPDHAAGQELIAIPIHAEAKELVPVGPGAANVVDLGVRVSGAPALSPAEAQFGLSPRENSVLLVLVEGRTNREIAERLFISERTVAVHVRRILAKLGVGGRTEAAGMAIRLGLVPDDPRVTRGSRASATPRTANA